MPRLTHLHRIINEKRYKLPKDEDNDNLKSFYTAGMILMTINFILFGRDTKTVYIPLIKMF